MKSYEVLGHQVTFRPDRELLCSADEVVALVEQEAQKLRQLKPTLANGETALLVALKLSADLLNYKLQIQQDIAQISQTATDLIDLLGQESSADVMPVSPQAESSSTTVSH